MIYVTIYIAILLTIVTYFYVANTIMNIDYIEIEEGLIMNETPGIPNPSQYKPVLDNGHRTEYSIITCNEDFAKNNQIGIRYLYIVLDNINLPSLVNNFIKLMYVDNFYGYFNYEKINHVIYFDIDSIDDNNFYKFKTTVNTLYENNIVNIDRLGIVTNKAFYKLNELDIGNEKLSFLFEPFITKTKK